MRGEISTRCFPDAECRRGMRDAGRRGETRVEWGDARWAPLHSAALLVSPAFKLRSQLLSKVPHPASKNVFESLKSTIQDLLNGRVAPTDRRAAIYEMKRALVSAKLGVEDLREGVEITRRK